MAQLKDHFQNFISDPKRRRIYEREALAFEASELISRLMEEQQVSKTDLARLVGTSKSHVTQLLSGSRNMTVHTLADLAVALGHKVEIRSLPRPREDRAASRRSLRMAPATASPRTARSRGPS
jgi:transcriptional regulator with XRE-family HTH domain